MTPCPSSLPTSDVGHVGRHYGHELDVGIQWKACHIGYGARDMSNIHGGLYRYRAIGLRHSIFHLRSQVRLGITYIDLAASNVIFPSVQSGRFRQSGDRVFCGRIGDRIRTR